MMDVLLCLTFAALGAVTIVGLPLAYRADVRDATNKKNQLDTALDKLGKL